MNRLPNGAKAKSVCSLIDTSAHRGANGGSPRKAVAHRRRPRRQGNAHTGCCSELVRMFRAEKERPFTVKAVLFDGVVSAGTEPSCLICPTAESTTRVAIRRSTPPWCAPSNCTIRAGPGVDRCHQADRRRAAGRCREPAAPGTESPLAERTRLCGPTSRPGAFWRAAAGARSRRPVHPGRPRGLNRPRQPCQPAFRRPSSI